MDHRRQGGAIQGLAGDGWKSGLPETTICAMAEEERNKNNTVS